MPAVIGVEGLRELDRALGQIDKDLRREFRHQLREIAEPVRAEASRLAAEEIRNIGSRWPTMRVGATSKGAYIVPKARSRGGSKRPNLAALLLNRAMLPAAEGRQAETEARLERWLDGLGRKAGF